MAAVKLRLQDLKVDVTFQKKKKIPKGQFYIFILHCRQKESGIPMLGPVFKHEAEVFLLEAKVLGDMSVTAVIFCFTCWQTYISKQQQKRASPAPCKPRR